MNDQELQSLKERLKFAAAHGYQVARLEYYAEELGVELEEASAAGLLAALDKPKEKPAPKPVAVKIPAPKVEPPKSAVESIKAQETAKPEPTKVEAPSQEATLLGDHNSTDAGKETPASETKAPAHEGVSWDAPGFEAPKELKAQEEPKAVKKGKSKPEEK